MRIIAKLDISRGLRKDTGQEGGQLGHPWWGLLDYLAVHLSAFNVGSGCVYVVPTTERHRTTVQR